MGGKSGKAQTIGYKYFMSLLMGIGRGPIDEVVQIKVGEKVAWTGPLVNGGASAVAEINAANLFGGDDKEGGIYGPFRMFWGEATQTVNMGPVGTGVGTLPSLAASIGGNMPAMRGVTTLWFDGEVCSMNPYPKEWKLRMRRAIRGWFGGAAWYPAKAVIDMGTAEIVSYKRAVELDILALFLTKGGSKKQNVVITLNGNIRASNGAHVIYECITNPEWGRGISATLIDDAAFRYAADTLFNEAFGVCFWWARKEDVDVFIQTVLDHIGGVLYTDRESGLLTLRLIRNDYDPDNIPTFAIGAGLLDILLDDSGSQDIAYNEVVVKFHDPVSDTDGEARAQNVGARIAQGSTNSLSKEYPGLPTKFLAARVALRELVVQSSGLKKYKVKLDRTGWRIAPGMPFRIICPQRNIGSIILRAGEIMDSSAQAGGDVQISALEDVFAMPSTSLVVPEDQSWVPPVSDAVAPDDSEAIELSYYDLTLRLSQFDLPAIDEEDSYVGFMAAQPLPTQVLYDLMYRAEGDATWINSGTNSFTAAALLVGNIGPYDTALVVEDAQHFPEDILTDSLQIGQERMRIDAYNPTTGAMTVSRGAGDTLPQSHSAGARVWLPDDDMGTTGIVYSAGEVVELAAATRANASLLLPEDYEIKTLEMQQRVGRPYPVANLKVGGTLAYNIGNTEYAEPVFTWATRNRVLQEDHLLGHTEGSVVEEDGTTYEVEIKSPGGAVIRTEELPAGSTTFTYDIAMQDADTAPSRVVVDIYPVRNGLRPLYRYDVTVVLKTGYGRGYGYNYGGA
ncbi:hypothetical protein [Sphingomonas phage Carli]|nr:hypothetical protein [Sphingomonas phage Carli]